MVTIAQQAVDKVFEKLNQQFSPEEQALMKQSLLKVLENRASYKDALNISDKIMETCYNQAYKLFQAGKYREAAEIFEALKVMDFKNSRYSLGAGACYHYLKDYDKAAGNYYICKEIDPFNPIPSFHLYDCLMQLNQPLPATEALFEVIVRCGDDPDYQLMKQKALLEKENLAEHLKTWVEQKKI